MRVRLVDGEMRAVEKIAEHFVTYAYGSPMAGHVPLGWVRLRSGDRRSAAIVYLHVVYISRKLVHGVSARRRPRHHDFQRSRGYISKCDFDLHPMVLCLWKTDVIRDGRLRERGRGEEQECDSCCSPNR
jgi:hypothetical protein